MLRLQQQVLVGAESLTGNLGANTLDGVVGADNMAGGEGNDTYVVDNLADVITETSTSVTQIDTVQHSRQLCLGCNEPCKPDIARRSYYRYW